MATKKVRKFASGGDIITGLGAVLVGKALYDKYKGGKDADGDSERKITVPKTITEGEPPKKEAAKEKPTNESSYAPDSKVGPKDIGFTGDGADTKPKPKPKPIVRKTPLASGPADRTDDVIGAGVRNAQIGRTAPAPDKTKPVEKKSPSFLSKKITTPGDPNKKEATSKAGVVFGGSTVRSDKDKMAERAREVQRRREEEMKSRYKTGGSVSSASKRADGCAVRGKTRGKVY